MPENNLTLYKSFAATLFTVVMGYGVYYVVNLLIANAVPVDVYGDYTFVNSVVFLMAPFVLLGGNKSALRFIPHYLAEHHWDKLRAFVAYYTRMAVLIAIGLSLLGLVLNHVLSRYALNHPLFRTGILLLVLAMLFFYASILESIKKTVIATALPNVIADLVMLCLLWLLFYELHIPANIWLLLLVFAGSYLSVTAVALFVFRHFITLPTTQQYNYQDKREWLSFGLMVTLSSLAMKLLDRADLILLEMLGKSEVSVGIFGACLIINELQWLTQCAYAPVLRPRIAEYSQKKQPEHIQKAYNTLFWANAWVSLLITLGSLVFGRTLLQKYGLTYLEGWEVLILLTLGSLVSVLLGMTGMVATYMGYANQMVKATALTIVLSVIAMIVLIPKLDMMGAAIVRVASLLILSGYGYYLMKYKLRFKPLILF